MADKKADGGPAFPGERTVTREYPPGQGLPPSSTSVEKCQGMTLRDYFAAKAPAPPPWWLKEYKECYGSTEKLSVAAEHLAAWAYEYADAMLAERLNS